MIMRIKQILSLLIFSIVFLIANSGQAQESYEEWLKKDKQSFKEFLAEEDKAFLEFLKKEWKSFQTQKGKKDDVKPKPVNMPVAKEKDKPKPPAEETPKKITAIPEPVKEPLPKPKPKPVVKESEPRVTVKFYGLAVKLNFNKNIDLKLDPPFNNEKISAAWKSLAAVKVDGLISQLKDYSRHLRLNDWGYVVLIHSLAKAVYPDSPDKQNIFSWFLVLKSGYNAKVAYTKESVYLLMPNENLIYENRYVTLDKTKYYFISFAEKIVLDGQVYSYNGNYKDADKIMGMKISVDPSLQNQVKNKTLSFKFRQKAYQIPVSYKIDMINFFKDYPQTDLELYFEAPVSNEAGQALLDALRPHVKEMSEQEAVNFLLRFAQTAFKYQTDDQQFGREKYLLPEETLYYPASDCEDRSILFSYLVKNLLGLQVIALDYPGHISTAVKFSDDITGDSVEYEGKRFVICDPTYINADAGMCMPEYKGISPQVIRL